MSATTPQPPEEGNGYFMRAREFDKGEGVEQDLEEAVRLYRLAADRGHADAQKNLGNGYYNGEGVEQDYTEAVRFYRLAADQGHAVAQYNLGECYCDGEGVEQDYTEATRLYRLAAEQGDPDAQVAMGYCYDNGEGVDQDKGEAVKWYRLAADQGDPDAQFNLGRCYRNGEGVNQDLEEATRLYRLAADQGDPDAQVALGYCYDNGEGVDQDLEEAARLYRLAAEQGDAVAQYSLGDCYQNGEGVEQDYTEAARLFQLAADQGYADAQAALGICYFKGNGVQRDCDAALYWLRLSGKTDDSTVSVIEKIEKSSCSIPHQAMHVQCQMIFDRESPCGRQPNGDSLVHCAARAMNFQVIAMLYSLSVWDELVESENNDGKLPRDVVATLLPQTAFPREARALRSILSVSRRTRAACVLWCFEMLRKHTPERFLAHIPLDIVNVIVRHLMPCAGPGSRVLPCSFASLMNSSNTWT
jgi:TPR repeat protein